MAENVYWLGRYLERAEDLARALLAYEEIRLDIPGQKAPGWQRLAALAGTGPETAAELDAEGFVARVILDRANPSSLLGALHAARENLRKARTILPSECWHTLNPLYLAIGGLDVAVRPAELSAHLERVVARSRELAGHVSGSMLRDDGYRFLRLGMHLERADMMLRVATIVAATLIPADHEVPFADVRAMGLLKSVGAFGTYRHRYQARADFKNTLNLLLYEPGFPRSFVHALLEMGRDLDDLPESGATLTALQACWPTETVDSRPALDAFARTALERLAALGDALAASYFSEKTLLDGQGAAPPRVPRRPGGTTAQRQELKEEQAART
jgi:uncharacterized alpha-E superfamily protein